MSDRSNNAVTLSANTRLNMDLNRLRLLGASDIFVRCITCIVHESQKNPSRKTLLGNEFQINSFSSFSDIQIRSSIFYIFIEHFFGEGML